MTLTTTDAFALLVHDGETGKPLIDAARFRLGVAGAILSDLTSTGRIGLDGKRVVVTDESRLGDEVLDAHRALVGASPRLRTPLDWISRFSTRDTAKAVMASLADRGLVEARQVDVLGIVPTIRYRILAADVVADALENVRAVLDGSRPASPEESSLIMLADATGLLRRRLGRVPAKKVTAAIESAWADEAVATAVDRQMRRSMQAATSAQINAAMAGAVAASVAASTAAIG